MKKISLIVFVSIVFAVSMFLFKDKIFAAVSVSVTANGTRSSLTVPYGTGVTIDWSPSNADYCTLNGSSVSGTSYSYTATSTRTFTVECRHTVVSSSVYFKLCPNTSGAGTYYTTGTAGSYYTGQQVTGAIWCNPFYEYTVCGSSSNPSTYSMYTGISVTPSVCVR